jgi:hypothetical protein
MNENEPWFKSVLLPLGHAAIETLRFITIGLGALITSKFVHWLETMGVNFIVIGLLVALEYGLTFAAVIYFLRDTFAPLVRSIKKEFKK